MPPFHHVRERKSVSMEEGGEREIVWSGLG
jgi:hypothetical protein